MPAHVCITLTGVQRRPSIHKNKKKNKKIKNKCKGKQDTASKIEKKVNEILTQMKNEMF